MSLDEVEDVYLPLSRLLNLHVAATQTLHKATDTFLGQLPSPAPYVIGIAGSVAVGKSTVRAHAAGAAGALARSPARRPRHDRRLPVPERGLEERG